MFEAGYTRELIQIGYDDVLRTTRGAAASRAGAKAKRHIRPAISGRRTSDTPQQTSAGDSYARAIEGWFGGPREALARRCGARSRADAFRESARPADQQVYTDRCCPPVQPIATVRLPAVVALIFRDARPDEVRDLLQQAFDLGAATREIGSPPGRAQSGGACRVPIRVGKRA